VPLDSSSPAQHDGHGSARLGPLLCWAVVFADIGSSIYYVPGILYSTVGGLAGFFVLLTMGVFVLLTFKYAEVSQRFPEGGGVVSVAAEALNAWAGALGGMLILVSYFLTAAISCLSAIQYFGVVLPVLLPSALWITVGVLVLLGLLNWVGISESAKVSLIGALVAFGSDLAILWTVFSHLSLAQVLALIPEVFAHATLTPTSVLVGFAGAFLAFSGLESISQLSPVMKAPRKKVISLALLFVAITIMGTSPLLTMLSTLLQPQASADEVLSTQLISLLGGHWGNNILQVEVAISAGLILVFASNTAIIGAYHVFMALSRMDFFPNFILQKNRLRGTPHWSIILATGIPIIILLLVNGRINLLGDLYAFGLLGAFTLTCLGIDLIRYREGVRGRRPKQVPLNGAIGNGNGHKTHAGSTQATLVPLIAKGTEEEQTSLAKEQKALELLDKKALLAMSYARRGGWRHVDFWLGILTTGLVGLAWVVSLVAKPEAALFGGSVALLGLGVAYVNYMRQGRPPVAVATLEGHLTESVLAVLFPGDRLNAQVVEAAVREARGNPVVFLYVGEQRVDPMPQPFEIIDPYLDDVPAKAAFSKAEALARKARVSRRFLYRRGESSMTAKVWQVLQPRSVILSETVATEVGNINPDRIRYEITPGGKIAHLLKRWSS
jgi:amino acid transporter